MPNYLYNGVSLPDLPTEISEFPFAVISRNIDGLYTLILCKESFVCDIGSTYHSIVNAGQHWFTYKSHENDSAWQLTYEGTSGIVNIPLNPDINIYVWTSHDITGWYDDTVYFHGSDPISGEEPKSYLYNGISRAIGRVIGRRIADQRNRIPPPYLTFSSNRPFTIATNNSAKNWNGTLYYSTDAEVWNVWNGATTLSSGNTNELYMRGTGNKVITGDQNCGWSLNGSNIQCSGNIENLLDYETVKKGEHPVMDRSCYFSLFKLCRNLIKAPDLPATTLSKYCYSNMFFGCSNLIKAPKLPATILVEGCYREMFRACNNLTKAPELPATKLADFCYNEMFYQCDSLIEAPELPATTLAVSCYSHMFSDCTSLTIAPELPATTLAASCYSGMFFSCTNLTQVPELPATTLADDCYYAMFGYCNIAVAPKLPATKLAEYCYGNMFVKCTNLAQPPELPATTLAASCYSGMFSYCTSLTIAPELPATTLGRYCYSTMFSNCSSLTKTPDLPANILEQGCYNGMFRNCSGLTQLPELPATTLLNYCYDGMFRGCTNIKLSIVQTDEYNIPYRIPTNGTATIESRPLYDMFTETGGDFTGTPSINTMYYISGANETIT